jgi:adenosylcobinamide-phosphate synthase
VAKACVESTLENGNDAVFGVLFWFALFGGAGAVLFRLSNTLDAMWGYKTGRFLRFGWAAARIDDLLNYVPARLTAISYALLGQTRVALACWRRQAPTWESPNAGPVMSAGAGSLGLALGGPAIYHGQIEERPSLGEGLPARREDIPRALSLVRRGIALWLAAFLVVFMTIGTLDA